MRDSGLSLKVEMIDSDEPDAAGVEIRAWSDRFAATTMIWLMREQLTEFADTVDGFPARVPDERAFELGHRNGDTIDGMRWAKGYCSLRLRFNGGATPATIDVYVEDSHSDATATFSLPTEASAIDRFVASTRNLARSSNDGFMSGEAVLRTST